MAPLEVMPRVPLPTLLVPSTVAMLLLKLTALPPLLFRDTAPVKALVPLVRVRVPAPALKLLVPGDAQGAGLHQCAVADDVEVAAEGACRQNECVAVGDGNGVGSAITEGDRAGEVVTRVGQGDGIGSGSEGGGAGSPCLNDAATPSGDGAVRGHGQGARAYAAGTE